MFKPSKTSSASSWHLRVLVLFIGLTLVMTYPLIFRLASGLQDTGDSLLNTWILAQNVHKISNLDFKHFFDANIFYPSKRTLAYSEFLFTQSLIAWPVILASGNPILAHNVVFLLAFITCGFGMYLLASELTKSPYCGIIAGLIYAYSPFMFAHLSHIQVLFAGGIPLAFLYLHRFFSTDSGRDLFFFGLFYIIQVLACGYFALYLTLFAGLFIVSQAIVRKKYADRKFWLKLGVFVLLVVVVAGPFFYQYVKVRQEMGFFRQGVSGAKLINFLSTLSINRVYGRFKELTWSQEGGLFPGGAAFSLALLGLILGLKLKIKKGESRDHPGIFKILSAVKTVLNSVIVFLLALIIFKIWFKGFKFSLGHFSIIGAGRPMQALLILVLLFIVRGVMARLLREKMPRLVIQAEKPLFIYTGILVLAFLFTFGNRGPYYFLYKYVPGFDGLRYSQRIQIFVMFSLAVLAAFGAKRVAAGLKGWKKPFLASLLPLLILAEYFSAPLRLRKFPVKDEIPEVYRWLGSQKKQDFALLELPLPGPFSPGFRLEPPRVYYSSYHWKNLINGFSGYSSPLYHELKMRWQRLPLRTNIDDLKVLNLRYLLLHADKYDKTKLAKKMLELHQLEQDLRLAERFGDTYVFEFTSWSPELAAGHGLRKPVFFSLRGSKVRTDINQNQAEQAVDGSLETQWQSGPLHQAHYFEVDLVFVATIKGVSLRHGPDEGGFPRSCSVEVSVDGIEWREVARRENIQLPLTAYLEPKALPLDILFPSVEARFIRITNPGEDPNRRWSIGELGIFK